MRRLLLCLAALLALTACGARSVYAPQDAVEAARFVDDGPPSVTLFTVISTRNGTGAHSGLLINGAQRVMFDPAGTWHHPRLPERNDVHYGITDKMVNFYIDYHARETFDVIEQVVPVTPEVAELVRQRAEANGAVAKAHCAQSISAILRGVPGFESIPATWSPKKLSKAFGALPGATMRTIHDKDADNNHGVLIVQAAESPLSP